MTDPLDAYGDALRRALHAEADPVVPAPDGLERIRARINERQLGWGWFTENWGRPAVALGAAVFIALVAISAPPALHVIEGITAGDSGSADSGGSGHGVTNPTNVPGQPGNPAQVPPGQFTTPEPSSSPSPQQSPRLGTPTCAPPSAGAATPNGTKAHSRPDSCTSPPPPAVTPPPDPPTPPSPEPTVSDTPAATPEPTAPQEPQHVDDGRSSPN